MILKYFSAIRLEHVWSQTCQDVSLPERDCSLSRIWWRTSRRSSLPWRSWLATTLMLTFQVTRGKYFLVCLKPWPTLFSLLDMVQQSAYSGQSRWRESLVKINSEYSASSQLPRIPRVIVIPSYNNIQPCPMRKTNNIVSWRLLMKYSMFLALLGSLWWFSSKFSPAFIISTRVDTSWHFPTITRKYSLLGHSSTHSQQITADNSSWQASEWP